MTASLQERFVATLDELELPEADLVTPVMLSVVEERRGSVPRPRMAIGFALVILVVALILAIEPTREAVADFFGIGTTRVEIVPEEDLSADLPGNAELTATTQRSTLTADSSEANTIDGTEPAVDADPIPMLGSPVEVADLGVARGRRYTWPADEDLPPLGDTETGLILSVRRAEGPLDVKRVASEAELVMVSIDYAGVPTVGLWIGSDHELITAGSTEPVLSEQVLLWAADGIQYRLEGDLPVDRMQQLAQSVEGGTDLLQPG